MDTNNIYVKVKKVLLSLSLIPILGLLGLGCLRVVLGGHSGKPNWTLTEVFSSASSDFTEKNYVSIDNRKLSRSYKIPKNFGVFMDQKNTCKSITANKFNRGDFEYDIMIIPQGNCACTVTNLYYDSQENKLYDLMHNEYANMSEGFRKMMLSLEIESDYGTPPATPEPVQEIIVSPGIPSPKNKKQQDGVDLPIPVTMTSPVPTSVSISQQP
jgi:hypothetical protein